MAREPGFYWIEGEFPPEDPVPVVALYAGMPGNFWVVPASLGTVPDSEVKVYSEERLMPPERKR